MIRTSLGPGMVKKHRTRSRVTKGYSENRKRYDRRRRLNPDTPETAAYREVLRRDPCSWCGQPAERRQDVDHITPLSTGGLDQWENMTAGCAPCNRGRRETPMLDMLLRARTRGDHRP